MEEESQTTKDYFMNTDIISNNIEALSSINLKTKFAMYVPALCPNSPKSYTLTEVDRMLEVFIRYSLRTIFFFDKYFHEYREIFNLIEEKYGYEKNLKIRIENNIYYYLDSAIVSFKSITEPSVINPLKIRDKNIKNILLKSCRRWFEEINKINLGKLRNEIVHLNEFGLSLSSWAKIDVCSRMIKIYYGNYITESIDQNKVSEIFKSSLNYIDEIIGIILTDYFKCFGFPDLIKQYFWENESNPISLNEYKIVSQ